MSFSVYLLDIEGTTTPIDFVSETLFPYARARLEDFIPTVEEYEMLAEEWAGDSEAGREPPSLGSRYLEWLMDQDRKSTGLKSIQGRIWEEGYESGDLKGEVYGDVVPAMERWRLAGARVAIFSSGSVLAQKLIFGYSTLGDLRGMIDGFFDTTTGPKKDSGSYRAIAEALGVATGEVCFLSDAEGEVAAARDAGMTGCLVVRGEVGLQEFPDRVSDFSLV